MSRLQTRGTPEPRINLREIERAIAAASGNSSTLRSDVNSLLRSLDETRFEMDTDRR